MSRLPSPARPRYKSMHEAEQAAIRIFGMGLSAVGIGLVMIIAMADNTIGIIAILLGFAVVIGGTLWLLYMTEYKAEARPCPRCGKPNRVFEEENYFKCLSCGHVVILHER